MKSPVHSSSQLRQQLKALRKARGLTQAAVGRLLGVGQARVAEIESNPGVVSLDQMVKLLRALNASLVLRDDGAAVAAVAAHSPGDAAKLPAAQASEGGAKPIPRLDAKTHVDAGMRVPRSTGQHRPAPVPRSGGSGPSDGAAWQKAGAVPGRFRPKKRT